MTKTCKISPRFLSPGRTIGSWSSYPLSTNSRSVVKVAPPVIPPAGQNWSNVLEVSGMNANAGGNSESGAFGQIVIPDGSRATVEQLNCVGVWAYNPTSTVKEFFIVIYNGNFSASSSAKGAVAPGVGWQLIVIPRLNFISQGITAADVVGAVRISEAASIGSWPRWQAGEKVYFGDISINPRGRSTFLLGTDDGFLANIFPSNGNGYPSSGRSYLEIASKYGYGSKICAYIVPDFLGRSGYLFLKDVTRMQDYGFVIASHSDKHPQDTNNSGLKLLGPYGYYLSQLSSRGWGADSPVINTASGTNSLTTSAPHRFISGSPIEFVGSAPPGLSANVPYYVNVTSGNTFRLSTSQGGSPIGLSNWSGSSHYRYSGSAPDDSAIYADVMLGANKLADMGFISALDHFALPQGAWDSYVASAIGRCGFKTVRGVSSSTYGHGVPGVMNSGGARYGSSYTNYGWINLPGSLQMDGSSSLESAKTDIESYINFIIELGGVGSSYGHNLSALTAQKFSYLCSYLRSKEKEGLIDVIDMDEYAQSVYPLT